MVCSFMKSSGKLFNWPKIFQTEKETKQLRTQPFYILFYCSLFKFMSNWSFQVLGEY